MSFRFIHTADLHLDTPLRAMAMRDAELAQDIGIASRTAFSGIVDLCIETQVAFLLIAGDLWDREYISTKTPRFLKRELLRLQRAGIGCYIIRGNHDALARQTGELEAPENTLVFGGRAQTVELEVNGHPVAIHGLSFRDAHVTESLLPRYPAPKPEAFNIGMMHTSLDGSPRHDNYAPCSTADLDGHGYDYWALGHIHRRGEYRGRATIVMPGTPQARDIGEAGDATVTLVTVGDDHSVTLEQRVTAPIRFERVGVDCAGLAEWPDMLAVLERSIRDAANAPREEEMLVIRPVLTGNTQLAWLLARDLDRLTEEARVYAADAADAGVLIDKLDLRVTADDGQMAMAQLPEDLLRIVLQDLPQDPALIAALTDTAQDLSRDLPAELRDMLGQDEAELARICRELLEQGSPAILSTIATGRVD